MSGDHPGIPVKTPAELAAAVAQLFAALAAEGIVVTHIATDGWVERSREGWR